MAKTFEEFQTFCADQQLSYIKDERARFRLAHDLATEHGHEPYEAQKYVFHPLGLWPHTITEIDNRFIELDKMEARIPEDFGDNPTMRFSYNCWINRDENNQ